MFHIPRSYWVWEKPEQSWIRHCQLTLGSFGAWILCDLCGCDPALTYLTQKREGKKEKKKRRKLRLVENSYLQTALQKVYGWARGKAVFGHFWLRHGQSVLTKKGSLEPRSSEFIRVSTREAHMADQIAEVVVASSGHILCGVVSWNTGRSWPGASLIRTLVLLTSVLSECSTAWDWGSTVWSRNWTVIY